MSSSDSSICGTCVDLPQPVSPAITTTRFVRTAARMSLWTSHMGSVRRVAMRWRYSAVSAGAALQPTTRGARKKDVLLELPRSASRPPCLNQRVHIPRQPATVWEGRHDRRHDDGGKTKADGPNVPVLPQYPLLNSASAADASAAVGGCCATCRFRTSMLAGDSCRDGPRTAALPSAPAAGNSSAITRIHHHTCTRAHARTHACKHAQRGFALTFLPTECKEAVVSFAVHNRDVG